MRQEVREWVIDSDCGPLDFEIVLDVHENTQHLIGVCKIHMAFPRVAATCSLLGNEGSGIVAMY